MTFLFISYSRTDDEPFAKRLYHDLCARGFTVWWDRAAMESRGRTFLQELRDGVEQVERVVAVIGPAAQTFSRRPLSTHHSNLEPGYSRRPIGPHGT